MCLRTEDFEFDGTLSARVRAESFCTASSPLERALSTKRQRLGCHLVVNPRVRVVETEVYLESSRRLSQTAGMKREHQNARLWAPLRKCAGSLRAISAKCRAA